MLQPSRGGFSASVLTCSGAWGSGVLTLFHPWPLWTSQETLSRGWKPLSGTTPLDHEGKPHMCTPKAPCDLGATPGSPPSSPGAADSLLVLHPQPGEHKAAMSNADSAVRLPSSSPAERTRRDTAGGGGEASGWGVWGGGRGGEGREAVSFPQSASRALRCLHNAWVQIYTSSPNDRVCLNTYPQACCGYTRVSVYPRLYKACL